MKPCMQIELRKDVERRIGEDGKPYFIAGSLRGSVCGKEVPPSIAERMILSELTKRDSDAGG